ncbi:TDE2508 family outer membrane beta-barrel protein [Treponema zioleckii]|uniref:TDE2508 family outer membrane beta-barrel protein n=1 Tax=Treponema zioleckii TaxID=331680 RepID=UPI00168B48F1|nr:hypothetical protein [Treponema zioleckii]
MKKLITIAAALALTFGAASAQESETSISTAGIFGNDVDDFMDVNSWSNVNPENMFGYVGVGTATYGRPAYELGFAKNFGGIYWGSFFGGDFGNYTKTSTGNTDSSVSATTDSTNWEFDNIIGFDNMGFKLSFSYYDNNSSKTDDDNFTDYSSWYVAGQFGINLGNLTPHVGISYRNNSNFVAYTKVNGTENDPRMARLNFFGGLGIELSGEPVEQKLDLDLGVPVYIKGDDAAEDGYVGLEFEPYYTVKYKASDALSLGAKLGLPFEFGFGDTFTFELNPSVDAGLSYKVTEKLTLNSGIKFKIVGFSYASNSDADTSTFTANGDDGYVTFKSGFNYALNEKVSLDFNWDVLSGIFGSDFNSDFDTGSSSDAFWGNMNTIFKNQFGFIVVMKF